MYGILFYATWCIQHEFLEVKTFSFLNKPRQNIEIAVSSGLVVPGSNLTPNGCIYDSHCDMQPWARAAHLYCSAVNLASVPGR